MTIYPTNKYESFRINELRGVAFTKYYYIEIARKRYFNVP
jgi:hypothetical protein